MKAFIASENVRHGIILSNALNALGINTSQNDSGYADQGALVYALAKNAQSFDICFAISHKPIDLSIDSNKLQGLRAAYCKDSSDIANARKAGANVIVLDASIVSREGISNIIGSWLANEGFQKGITKALYGFIGPKSPSSENAEQQSVQLQKQAKKKGAQKDTSMSAYDKNKGSTDEEDDSGPKGKGIVNRLKYALGLE